MLRTKDYGPFRIALVAAPVKPSEGQQLRLRIDLFEDPSGWTREVPEERRSGREGPPRTVLVSTFGMQFQFGSFPVGSGRGDWDPETLRRDPRQVAAYYDELVGYGETWADGFLEAARQLGAPDGDSALVEHVLVGVFGLRVSEPQEPKAA